MEESATSSVTTIGDASDVSGHASRPGEEPVSPNGVPLPVPDIRETISASAAALEASCTDRLPSSLPPVCDNEPAKAASASTMSPRAYQLEMLQQSLNQNTIVVVSTPSMQYIESANQYTCRWIPEAARRRCKCLLPNYLPKAHPSNSVSAVLRIKAELEKSDPDQVIRIPL